MVKYIIWSYVPLFTTIHPYLAILAIFATICVIIYPYFTKSTLISHTCPYLAIFALIWQHLPMFTLYCHIYPCWSYLPLVWPCPTLCVLILKLCAKL